MSVIVIGAGPGIGVSVARRFARAGHSIGVVARSRSTIDAARAAVADAGVVSHGVAADAGDETALRSAIDELVERHGIPDVLVYNAAVIQWDALGELGMDEHLRAWSVNVGGAITAASHVLPRMAELGRGTFIVTGGMPSAVPGVVSLSLGKAGVRALTQLLATQFGPAGVHVATITVAGAVAPGSAFDPDDIADEYVRLHEQAPDEWHHEVVYSGRN